MPAALLSVSVSIRKGVRRVKNTSQDSGPSNDPKGLFEQLLEILCLTENVKKSKNYSAQLNNVKFL